jgi:hypothetical protein
MIQGCNHAVLSWHLTGEPEKSQEDSSDIKLLNLFSANLGIKIIMFLH